MTDILRNIFSEYEMGELENSLNDPNIDRTLNSVKEFNQLLAGEEEVDEEDLKKILRQLDRNWLPYMRQKVTFSGTLMSFDGSFNDVEVSSADVVSNGFCAIKRDEDSLSIQHHFIVNANMFDSTIDASYMVLASAKVEGSTIECSTASLERASSWIHSSYPELREDLDIAVLNSNTTEETILALKDVVLPSRLDREDHFTVHCIEKYLEENIPLDTIVPYAISLTGYLNVDSEDEMLTVYTNNPSETLIVDPSLVVGPVIINDDVVGELSICIEGYVVNPDVTTIPVKVSIPLTSLLDIRSVRDDFYGGNL